MKRKISKNINIIIRFVMMVFGVLSLFLFYYSHYENLLYLFLGLGIIFAVMMAWAIKKFSYFLLLPFVILLAAGLYIVNSLDFNANVFRVTFLDPANYIATLNLTDDSSSLEVKVSEDVAIAPLPLIQADNLILNLEKQPNFLNQAFVLSNFTRFKDFIKAEWSLSGSINYLPLPESNDTLIENDYENLYYRREESLIESEGFFKYLVIEFEPTNDLLNFVVSVDGVELKPLNANDRYHYFEFEEKVDKIRRINILEEGISTPFNLETLEPIFERIYLVESEPDTIVFKEISLDKYFGSINTYLPFYRWTADEIEEAFTIRGGELSVQNGLIFIDPSDITVELDLKDSPSSIAAIGLEKFKPYILAGNILFLVLGLGGFVGVSILINQNSLWIKSNFQKFKTLLKDLGDLKEKIPSEIALFGVTPFKIVFLIFLLLFWLFIFMSWTETAPYFWLKVPALLLSVFLLYYLLREIRIEGK